MSDNDSLTLQVTSERLNTLCAHLMQRATRAEQGMAGLIALQSLLATMSDPALHAAPAYRQLQGLLAEHMEQMRQRLLAESAARLAQALQARDSSAIASVYAPLSRSGFVASLEQVVGSLSEAELNALAQWIRQWHASATARGEAASGCPDAIDFAKADIDVIEFNAITDILRFIGTRTS